MSCLTLPHAQGTPQQAGILLPHPCPARGAFHGRGESMSLTLTPMGPRLPLKKDGSQEQLSPHCQQG